MVRTWLGGGVRARDRARDRARARVRANRIGGPLGATVDEDIGHVRLQLRLQPYVSGAATVCIGGCNRRYYYCDRCYN